MIKKVVFFVFIVIILFLILVLSFKSNLLNFEKIKDANQQSSQINSKSKSFNYKDQLFFSFSFTQLNDNQYQIVFEVKGNKNSKMDAADLYLKKYNIKIVKIEKGDAFPNYPLIKNVNDQIRITGNASIRNNQIIYGRSNKVFVRLTVEKIDPQKINYLTLNPQETDIFLNGKSIYDQNKKLLIIRLP